MDNRGRAHWNAVRRAFAQDVPERDIDAAKLSPEERVRLGLRMGALLPCTPALERELDRLGVAQAKLHERWRRLQERRGRGA